MKLGCNSDLVSFFMETWSIFGPSFNKLSLKLGPDISDESVAVKLNKSAGLIGDRDARFGWIGNGDLRLDRNGWNRPEA